MTTTDANNIISVDKTCKGCGRPFTATMTRLEPMGWPMSPKMFKETRQSCPECKASESEARRQRMANEVLGWTFETVKQHFKDHPPQVGDPLIVASSQFHQNEYLRVHVEKPEHTKQRRIIVDKPGTVGGTTFYRSGQNCYTPKGQTRLLPDHPVMAELFRRHGDRVVLDDKALAAVMAHAYIETFVTGGSFGPITARDNTNSKGE